MPRVIEGFVQLTALVDVNLLGGGLVEDGAGLEDLQGVGAGVGNGGLDGRVTDHLNLHIERRVALRSVDRHSGRDGGEESGTSEELHFEWL